MHSEMGYSYIGPTSFYLLTLDEIQRLQRGYATLNEDKSQKPRESDNKKLAAFNDKLAKLRG